MGDPSRQVQLVRNRGCCERSQASAKQHAPLIGVDLPVRNSQLINPRLPSAAELLTVIVSSDSRRNVWGAIAHDKIDCNIPEQRQPRRIQIHNTKPKPPPAGTHTAPAANNITDADSQGDYADHDQCAMTPPETNPT
jgi:hypothetical protein